MNWIFSLRALAASNILRKRKFPPCGAASFPAVRPQRGHFEAADSQVAGQTELLLQLRRRLFWRKLAVPETVELWRMLRCGVGLNSAQNDGSCTVERFHL